MAFKMKGHTLPGINQRSDEKMMECGRADSAPFQKKHKEKYVAEEGKTIHGVDIPEGATVKIKDRLFGRGQKIKITKKDKGLFEGTKHKKKIIIDPTKDIESQQKVKTKTRRLKIGGGKFWEWDKDDVLKRGYRHSKIGEFEEPTKD